MKIQKNGAETKVHIEWWEYVMLCMITNGLICIIGCCINGMDAILMTPDKLVCIAIQCILLLLGYLIFVLPDMIKKDYSRCGIKLKIFFILIPPFMLPLVLVGYLWG